MTVSLSVVAGFEQIEVSGVNMWLFAVDDGGSAPVFSGENVGTSSGTELKIARHDPTTGGSISWTTLLTGEFTDHQHIYAHGFHYISYASNDWEYVYLIRVAAFVDSAGTEIFSAPFTTRTIIGPTGSGALYESDNVKTNDHFLVATARGLAIGVRNGKVDAPYNGHVIVEFPAWTFSEVFKYRSCIAKLVTLLTGNSMLPSAGKFGTIWFPKAVTTIGAGEDADDSNLFHTYGASCYSVTDDAWISKALGETGPRYLLLAPTSTESIVEGGHVRIFALESNFALNDPAIATISSGDATADPTENRICAMATQVVLAGGWRVITWKEMPFDDPTDTSADHTNGDGGEIKRALYDDSGTMQSWDYVFTQFSSSKLHYMGNRPHVMSYGSTLVICWDDYYTDSGETGRCFFRLETIS